MKRRNFFGALSSLVAAPVAVKAAEMLPENSIDAAIEAHKEIWRQAPSEPYVLGHKCVRCGHKVPVYDQHDICAACGGDKWGEIVSGLREPEVVPTPRSALWFRDSDGKEYPTGLAMRMPHNLR